MQKYQIRGVLLLINNAMKWFNWLASKDTIHLYSKCLQINQLEELRLDLINRYNYMYLIKEEIIDYIRDNVNNLYISYLLRNRSVNPNEWEFG